MKKSITKRLPHSIDKLFDDHKSDENSINEAIDNNLVEELSFDELADELTHRNMEMKNQ